MKSLSFPSANLLPVPPTDKDRSDRDFPRQWYLSLDLKDKKEPGFAGAKGARGRKELVAKP